MEDKTKLVKIVVIAACLILAIAITLATREGGGGVVTSDKIWVKCDNPDCYAEYQMTYEEYGDAIYGDDSADPKMMTVNVLVCQECEEESVYNATKCSNKECGIVFISIPNPGAQDYPDRCPECGDSEMERILNERLG